MHEGGLEEVQGEDGDFGVLAVGSGEVAVIAVFFALRQAMTLGQLSAAGRSTTRTVPDEMPRRTVPSCSASRVGGRGRLVQPGRA